MTVQYRTRGFVFKKEDQNESDRVFSVFTEDFGRVELKAKSIRKITSKLRANIDLFYLSEIEFIQGRNNKTLTDAVRISRLNSEKVDFKKLKTAHRISDTLDSFIKGQEKDERTFALINEVFTVLAGNGNEIKNHLFFFHYFFWNFMSSQGYRLEVNKCATCQGEIKPYNIYFSATDGGIICQACFYRLKKGDKINSDVVKILRIILKKDIKTLRRLRMGQQSEKILQGALEKSVYAFSPAHN
jgi:DNA repair protein RecO (recombination protein O)